MAGASVENPLLDISPPPANTSAEPNRLRQVPLLFESVERSRRYAEHGRESSGVDQLDRPTFGEHFIDNVGVERMDHEEAPCCSSA